MSSVRECLARDESKGLSGVLLGSRELGKQLGGAGEFGLLKESSFKISPILERILYAKLASVLE